jgi:hypothetical protein
MPLAWTLVPPGVLSWLALLQMGRRAHVARWQRFGLFYAALTAVGVVELALGRPLTGLPLMLVVWVFATVHGLAISSRYQRRMRELDDPELRAAEQRLARRDQARRLARRDPERARQLGIGRPDLGDAYHGGLVDVNAAPVSALATLPGYDQALAERTVQLREQYGHFSSLEELGALADLTGPQVEQLRDHVVFLG